MRKNLYRAFSTLMIVVVLASSTMSSFAAGAAVGKFVAESFGGWIIENGLEAVGNYVKDHIGFSAGKVCKSSPDGYHHCESSGFGGGFKLPETDADGGRFTTVVCKYCSESFKYYTSFGVRGAGISGKKSDLQQSYETQVSELPATGYNSAGALLWSPEISYVYLPQLADCPHRSGGPATVDVGDCYITFDCSNMSVSFRPSSSNGFCHKNYFYEYFSGVYPIDGYYKRVKSKFIEGSFIYDSPSRTGTFATSFSPESDATLYYAGHSYSSSRDYLLDIGRMASYLSFQYFLPVYEVTPFEPEGTSTISTTYNINSRPTSITGDYGIIGDNGQITKVEGDTIINETNNTYYNPATGTTTPITDWSYDYVDRSYTLNLEGGKTSTVTYGDENVSITETDNSSGDTITNNYTIYYLVEGSGTDTPDPGPDTPDPGPDTPCNHSWSETGSTPATCTVPGSRLLTCSLCGATKTETIPAPGHTWEIKKTVQTQYDDTGQLIQQGYTIFECSVCHEQYKSENVTVPPGDIGPPEDGSGFLDSLAEMITGKLESVLKTVISIFGSVPSFFDGFLAFLSAMFPFLPPEIITLLTFGIAAVVFIGIIKAIRR